MEIKENTPVAEKKAAGLSAYHTVERAIIDASILYDELDVFQMKTLAESASRLRPKQTHLIEKSTHDWAVVNLAKMILQESQNRGERYDGNN